MALLVLRQLRRLSKRHHRNNDAAPAELSGTMKRAYDDALADVRRALDLTEFAHELKAGRAMDREAAIEYALAGAG